MAELPGERVDHHDLADQAATLARGLNKLRYGCGHESTSMDITKIAYELMLLATELRTLDRAVSANKEQYTKAFDEDLAEIHTQLAGILEDIADCCKEMQKADAPNQSAVGWFQKKRYVNKIHKHLEANKTALVVMRTVLHHGKSYGTQNSPERLAESSPHILQEDRAILESVFASRKAISELHDLTNKPHEQSGLGSPTPTNTVPSFQPGAHGRNLSSATGVDTVFVEDVLPARKSSRNFQNDGSPMRRFSRRGVGLAVHNSILDSDAHEVPVSLKKRWFYQGRRGSSFDRVLTQERSTAQLSRISEANSNLSPEKFSDGPILPRSSTTPGHSLQQTSDESSGQDQEPDVQPSKARKRGLTLMASPAGKTLGNVIRRLSNITANSEHKFDSPDLEIDGEKKTGEEKQTGHRSGWSYRLTKPFLQPELTTPDYEEDVENMASL